MDLSQMAKESQKTQRDRRKLLERFKLLDMQITKEALEDCIDRIKDRISRQAPFRVSLDRSSFELFDSNKHPKALSERVSRIASAIHNMFSSN